MGKKTIALDAVVHEIPALLEHLQREMFTRAKQKQQSQWHKATKLKEFGPILEEHNGIYQTGWCQTRECEDKLREYKATTRCLLENQNNFAQCFNCDQPSKGDILVAKAY